MKNDKEIREEITELKNICNLQEKVKKVQERTNLSGTTGWFEGFLDALEWVLEDEK